MHGTFIFPLTFLNYTNEISIKRKLLENNYFIKVPNPLKLVATEITANMTTTVFLKHFLLFGKYLIKRKQTFPWW